MMMFFSTMTTKTLTIYRLDQIYNPSDRISLEVAGKIYVPE